nr:YciC family protein [uncultured Brevundimonas sp.]
MTFFAAAALFVGIPSALVAFGQADLTTGESTATAFVLMILGWALFLVGAYVVQGMVVRAAINSFNDKQTTFGEALSAGAKVFLPLLGLAIVAGIATGFAYILLIVPGIILTVLWSVSAPAVVAEKRGIFEAMQRSRDLTRGYRWHIFGLLVIYLVLSMVVGMLVGGVNLAAGGTFSGGAPSAAVNMISNALTNALTSVVVSAGVAALYYELRAIKEGAGPEQLASVFD